MKALLLDAGGTIVFPNFLRMSEELTRDGIHVDPEALMRAEARVRFEMDRPEIVNASNDAQRWTSYLERLFRIVGLEKVPMAALRRIKQHHDAYNLWDFVAEDTPQALDVLAARFRLGIVSNSNGTVRKLFVRLGLADRFETIVDSHEEGVEKPDPRIFRIALDRMRLATADTGYLGDIYYIDVIGARAAELTPFLLDPLGLHKDKPVMRVKSLRELAECR